MKTIVLAVLLLRFLAACAAHDQNVSQVADVNLNNSNIDNAITPSDTDKPAELPVEMPRTVEFHYMYHNGQTALTKIDVKNGIVEYEHRESMTSWPVKRKRTLSRAELEALYRIFVENRFDEIRNDSPVNNANDTANDRISIDLGPRGYIQVVLDPIVSPLSGDSLKRFEAVKSAMFMLLDLSATK
jgi:hypothetical protein